MLLAGLDIGTSGCKITVYNTNGDCLDRVYHDYPHMRTTTEHEVDAALIWLAVREVLTEAGRQHPDIKGIGVTSFGETFVLLDENDKPVCNAMLYTDPRGEAECTKLCDELGREQIANITGVNPHPMYSIAKLMWIRDNHPEIFNVVKRVLLMADYIVYMLTGTAQIDYSLAARTMAFDVRALDWSDAVFNVAKIDKTLFSKPVPTGTLAGIIKPNTAKDLGLYEGVQIVSAGHDQIAAAVGSGVFDIGDAVDGAGTVECITPVFKGIPDGTYMRDGNYAIIPHVEKGKYVCYAFTYTGGALVQWFIDNLAGHAANDSISNGISIYEQLEGGKYQDGPTGILVLPHFAGAATPYMDYGAKGAIIGLTISSTQSDIYLALMEGVCYEMRLNKERLAEAGVQFTKLWATGGGAASRVWMQMKADILNVPVTSLRTDEAGGVGAAMMTGVATGVFNNLRHAATMMVTEKETYIPREVVHKRYSEAYKRYAMLYDAIRPLV